MAVLSISRQFGAGGKTLGEKVAQSLGYQFVDESLMEKVAEEANVSVRWVEGVEREAGGYLMRFLSSMVPSSFIDRHLGDSGQDFDEKRYVIFLSKVVEDLAEDAVAEFQHFSGHSIVEAIDARDAIADLKNAADFTDVHAAAILTDFLFNNAGDFFYFEFHLGPLRRESGAAGTPGLI